MTTLRLFRQGVEDGFGEFPDAIVAIHGIKELSERGLDVSEIENNAEYKETGSEVERVSFKANFWVSQEMREKGKRSRPLYVQDGDIEVDRISVDLASPSVVAAMNSAGDWNENLIAMCRAHLVELFSKSE